MEAETKLMGILTNEPSPYIEIPEFEVELQFQRPPLAKKHKHKAWAFNKMREYGYRLDEDNSGTMILQYWGQLNSFVIGITNNGKPFSYDPEKDTEYGSLYEKFVVEEIYNTRGLQEEGFVSSSILALARWLDSTEAEEEETKNS